MATKQSDRKQTVLDHLTAIVDGDFEAAAADFADDYSTTLTRPTGEEEELGVEDLRQEWEELLKTFPDLTIEPQEMAAEDDWVLVRNELTGTHEGESRFWDIQPTGEEVEWDSYASYRFEGDDIVEVNGVTDVVAALRQLDVDLPVKG